MYIYVCIYIYIYIYIYTTPIPPALHCSNPKSEMVGLSPQIRDQIYIHIYIYIYIYIHLSRGSRRRVPIARKISRTFIPMLKYNIT